MLTVREDWEQSTGRSTAAIAETNIDSNDHIHRLSLLCKVFLAACQGCLILSAVSSMPNANNMVNVPAAHMTVKLEYYHPTTTRPNELIDQASVALG